MLDLTVDTGTEQLSQLELWVFGQVELVEVVVSVLSLWMLHLAEVCLPLSGVPLLSD